MKTIKTYEQLNEAKENRVTLNYDDFVKLVNAEEILVDGSEGPVRMILQDVGFPAMIDAIKKAANNR